MPVTRKRRSRANRKTRNYKAKRINRRGGGPLPPPTKIPQTPDMTVEVGAFDMTVPKSSLEIGFVYNNMGQGSDPGWEGWNPAWTKRKGGGQAIVPAPGPGPAPAPVEKLPQSINMTVEVGAFDLTVYKTSLKPGTPYWGMGVGSDPGWEGWPPEWYNGQQGGAKLPQSKNMTVEVGAFDYTVPKSSLKPGTPYWGMGVGDDPGWEGWPPEWYTGQQGGAKLPQSKNMTVEVGAFDYTVPKSSLKPGTPYWGMGVGSDPGWNGWNTKWTLHPNYKEATTASASSSNNNSSSSSNEEEEVAVAEEAVAEEATVAASAENNNNNSTAEEERAENAGVNSFLSGGSRRRNRRR